MVAQFQNVDDYWNCPNHNFIYNCRFYRVRITTVTH